MIKHVRKTFYLFLGVMTLGCLETSVAKAQHIVTEAEAGKLTLESLTATPVVHHSRVVRTHYVDSRLHSNVRMVAYTNPVISRNKRAGSKLVRQVAYTVPKSKRPYSRLVRQVAYTHRPLFAHVRVKTAVYQLHSKARVKHHRS